MQILSYLRFSSIRLQAVAVALLLIFVNQHQGLARETYVQFAGRLLGAPPAGVKIRPDLEAAVLLGTNGYLSSKGLKPLRPASEILLQAARAQAMDLLLQGGMGHVSSNGYDFESRIRAFHQGQMFLAPMAENAARLRNSDLSDSAKAQALVQQWVTSSGHRKNMVNRTYMTMAVGVVSRGKDVYAVQIFSGPVVKTNMMGGQIPN
jgi:uncharacterized protein YkwD